MARLIRAVALMKRTDRYPPYISDTVRKELRYVPTVDAVEVVRCKDCVYCKRFNDVYQLPKLDVLICRYCCDEDEVTENDYCSWGERREDEVTE